MTFHIYNAGAPTDASEKLEFTRIPMSQLKKKLELAAGKTYVIIVSCPSQHMAAVRQAIKGNQNVLESFGSVGDLANNLEKVNLGGGGAEVRSLALQPTRAASGAPSFALASR